MEKLNEKKVKLKVGDKEVAEVSFVALDSVIYKWKQGYYDGNPDMITEIRKELGMPDDSPFEMYTLYNLANIVEEIKRKNVLALVEETKSRGLPIPAMLVEDLLSGKEEAKSLSVKKTVPDMDFSRETPLPSELRFETLHQQSGGVTDNAFQIIDKAEAQSIVKIAHMVVFLLTGVNAGWGAYVLEEAGVPPKLIKKALKVIEDRLISE